MRINPLIAVLALLCCGQSMSVQRGGSGPEPLVFNPTRRQIVYAPLFNTNTFSASFGGVTSTTLNSTADDLTRAMIRGVTAAAANSNSGVNSQVQLARWVQDPRVAMYVHPIDLTNVRYYGGLSSDVPANMLGSDTPYTSGRNFVGFRFSTAASDVNWQAVVSNTIHGDGTPAGQTVVDTGIPVEAGRTYLLEVNLDYDASAVFYIDDVVVARISDRRPPPSNIGFYMHHALRNLEAVSKTWGLGNVLMEMN